MLQKWSRLSFSKLKQITYLFTPPLENSVSQDEIEKVECHHEAAYGCDEIRCLLSLLILPVKPYPDMAYNEQYQLDNYPSNEKCFHGFPGELFDDVELQFAVVDDTADIFHGAVEWSKTFQFQG